MSLIKNELTEKSGFVMEFSVSKEAFAKAENEAYKTEIMEHLPVASDNFFGSQNAAAAPNFAVECFYFYTLNKCDGTPYLDNVSLYGNNGSCNDEICFEK